MGVGVDFEVDVGLWQVEIDEEFFVYVGVVVLVGVDQQCGNWWLVCGQCVQDWCYFYEVWLGIDDIYYGGYGGLLFLIYWVVLVRFVVDCFDQFLQQFEGLQIDVFEL